MLLRIARNITIAEDIAYHTVNPQVTFDLCTGRMKIAQRMAIEMAGALRLCIVAVAVATTTTAAATAIAICLEIPF